MARIGASSCGDALWSGAREHRARPHLGALASPTLLHPGDHHDGQSFPLYLFQVTALSVAIAWLYAHTKGSLLLVMILHAAINNTKDIVRRQQPRGNPFAFKSDPGMAHAGAAVAECRDSLIRMPRDA